MNLFIRTAILISSIFFISQISAGQEVDPDLAEYMNPGSPTCGGLQGPPCREKQDNAMRRGWIDFRDEGGREEYFEINSDSVVLMGHSALYWDFKGVTQPAVRELVELLRNRKVPIVYLSSNYKIDQKLEFLNYGDFDFVGYSSGGRHNLRLPKTKTVLVSGGYYHKCLCNSVLDVISNVTLEQEMNLIFPLETVYMSNSQDIIESLPAGARLFEDRIYTLREFLESSSSHSEAKKSIGKTVENLLFKKVNSPYLGPTMCPSQPGDGKINPEDFSIKVFLEDSNTGEGKQLINEFGNGPKRLNIIFSSLNLATDYLTDSVGPIKAKSLYVDMRGGDPMSEAARNNALRIVRQVPSRRN